MIGWVEKEKGAPGLGACGGFTFANELFEDGADDEEPKEKAVDGCVDVPLLPDAKGEVLAAPKEKVGVEDEEGVEDALPNAGAFVVEAALLVEEVGFAVNVDPNENPGEAVTAPLLPLALLPNVNFGVGVAASAVEEDAGGSDLAV